MDRQPFKKKKSDKAEKQESAPSITPFQKHMLMTRLEDTNKMQKNTHLAGFKRNTGIALSVLVTFIFFVLLGFFSVYWISYIHANALLDAGTIGRFIIGLFDGRFVELLLWMGGIFASTVLLTYGTEMIYSRRFVIYRGVLCILQLVLFVVITCLAMYTISTIFPENSQARSIFGSTPSMLIASILAALASLAASYYWILRYYPKNANNVSVYDPSVEIGNNEGVTGMHKISEAFELLDEYPEENKFLLAQDKIRRTMQERERKERKGQTRAKWLFSLTIGIWTMAFSFIICAFLVYGDGITTEQLSPIFNALFYSGEVFNLANAFIFFFTLVFAIYTYFGLAKILSFFMGSIIGEIRNGSHLWFCFTRSVYKTIENIPIILTRSIGVLGGFFWPFMLLFAIVATVFGSLFTMITHRRMIVSGRPEEQKQNNLRTFLFKLAIMVSGLFVFESFFKYFALGMYPKDAIRERVQGQFFEEREYISQIMGYVVLVFIAILLLIGLIALITYFLPDSSQTVTTQNAPSIGQDASIIVPADPTAAPESPQSTYKSMFRVLRWIFGLKILILLILPVAIFSLKERETLEKYRNFRRNTNPDALEFRPNV